MAVSTTLAGRDRAYAPDWLVLSGAESAGGPALLSRGMLVVEFALPLDGSTLILAQDALSGWMRHLSLTAHPAEGVTLLHRQGATILRHSLPGPLPCLRGTGRLRFAFDAPARLWRLGFEVVGQPGHERMAQGFGPMPLALGDLRDLAQRTDLPPSLLWFGASAGFDLPAAAPWIGPRTPIATAWGPVPAAELRPGDPVVTLDQGILPLVRLLPRRLPARGAFAPILLRSPYFGRGRDMMVSADQLVLITGAAVEYLYGSEEALAPAHALCDGNVAEREGRYPLIDGVALDLGRPALVQADGCCLLSAAGDAFAPLPRRALEAFELPPLMGLLGRGSLRHRRAA